MMENGPTFQGPNRPRWGCHLDGRIPSIALFDTKRQAEKYVAKMKDSGYHATLADMHEAKETT